MKHLAIHRVAEDEAIYEVGTKYQIKTRGT